MVKHERQDRKKSCCKGESREASEEMQGGERAEYGAELKKNLSKKWKTKRQCFIFNNRIVKKIKMNNG